LREALLSIFSAEKNLPPSPSPHESFENFKEVHIVTSDIYLLYVDFWMNIPPLVAPGWSHEKALVASAFGAEEVYLW